MSQRKNRVKKNASETDAPKRFAINFSSTAATALTLALVAVVGWAFFMGFMVGRGQNPEQPVEQIANALHIAPAFSPDKKPLPETGDAPQESADAKHEQNQPTPKNVPLKQDQSVAANQPDAPLNTSSVPPDTSRESYQFSHPQGAALSAWGIPDTGAKTKPQPPLSLQVQSRQGQKNTPRFDYTYQIAAFKTQKEADSLRAKLESRGLKARQNKNGKVFLVLVSLRGSDTDAATLCEELQKMGLGAPTLTSKKPVAAPERKQRR
ncbi:MAG: conserved hypothetical protein [Candidatus Desulfovibrio kirbyi]|uniref:SPOR domain-containing protein n=1 Tax=Candidatus Desulfovibrio kirbyi TaxID=2696086 RepID=A0A6L2R655_9BACT|nr:MAG: conserved hypothetical protein [Candidatus Desulfovibrio kirbyi]